jgi:hypothetical protein
MQDIIILGIATLILFVGSVIFFLIAITKKIMPLFYLALLLLFVGVGTGLFASYKFFYKSYVKISDSFKPRSGEEIYAALFDGNPNECTNVLEKQDQVVPKIDVAIYLHFKTCPEEIKRIIAQHEFEYTKLSTKDFSITKESGVGWFKPEILGDSILVYYFKKDELGNCQMLYVSTKMDEVFCKDVWD